MMRVMWWEGLVYLWFNYYIVCYSRDEGGVGGLVHLSFNCYMFVTVSED